MIDSNVQNFHLLQTKYHTNQIKLPCWFEQTLTKWNTASTMLTLTVLFLIRLFGTSATWEKAQTLLILVSNIFLIWDVVPQSPDRSWRRGHILNTLCASACCGMLYYWICTYQTSAQSSYQGWYTATQDHSTDHLGFLSQHRTYVSLYWYASTQPAVCWFSS